MARPILSSASHNSNESGLALDGDPATRWTSGVAMEPAMYYVARFAAPVMIGGIDARAADDTDNPKDWTVAVMDDAGGHGYREVAHGSGPIVATWPVERAQVVKIVCNSKEDFYWWSLAEVVIDAVEIPVIVEPEPPIIDEEVGPAVFNETLARYWVEWWARKFGWYLAQRDVISFEGNLVAWEQSVVYLRARARAGGIMEPWPFTDM